MAFYEITGLGNWSNCGYNRLRLEGTGFTWHHLLMSN